MSTPGGSNFIILAYCWGIQTEFVIECVYGGGHIRNILHHLNETRLILTETFTVAACYEVILWYIYNFKVQNITSSLHILKTN